MSFLFFSFLGGGNLTLKWYIVEWRNRVLSPNKGEYISEHSEEGHNRVMALLLKVRTLVTLLLTVIFFFEKVISRLMVDIFQFFYT